MYSTFLRLNTQNKTTTKIKAYMPTVRGPIAMIVEVTEIVPGYSMVEFARSQGDHLAFHQMYKEIRTKLTDIVESQT